MIDGPEKSSSFHPDRAVTKAELLKLMVLANKIDPKMFDDVKLPLSSDAGDPKQWYYPYLRYAISASMTMGGKSGLFGPARPLTRGDVAVLLHRFLEYKAGNRTQDLLDEAQIEMANVLDALGKSDATEAEYASARALLAARGAHESKPDEPIVRAAVKTAEAFRALVRAYRAGINQDFKTVVKLAGDAWFLADQAKKLSPATTEIATQLQTYAKNFADSARAQMK
jgi:hypothetical protein